MSSNFKIKKNTSNSRLLVHLALNEPFAILVQKSISMQRNVNNNFPINFWIPAKKLKLADEMINKNKGKKRPAFSIQSAGIFIFKKIDFSKFLPRAVFDFYLFIFRFFKHLLSNLESTSDIRMSFYLEK